MLIFSSVCRFGANVIISYWKCPINMIIWRVSCVVYIVSEVYRASRIKCKIKINSAMHIEMIRRYGNVVCAFTLVTSQVNYFYKHWQYETSAFIFFEIEEKKINAKRLNFSLNIDCTMKICLKISSMHYFYKQGEHKTCLKSFFSSTIHLPYCCTWNMFCSVCWFMMRMCKSTRKRRKTISFCSENVFRRYGADFFQILNGTF